MSELLAALGWIAAGTILSVLSSGALLLLLWVALLALGVTLTPAAWMLIAAMTGFTVASVLVGVLRW